MNIAVYINSADNRQVDKTSYLSQVGNYTGTARGEFSVQNPVFDVVVESPETIMNANYLYCVEYGRYYYISEVQIIRSKLVEMKCHVDVLNTFKTQIKSNTALIKRNENDWSLYIDDGLLNAYQNNIEGVKVFSNHFLAESGFSYVLMVAGSGSTGSSESTEET